MFKNCNLKILHIDHDGNATAQIYNNNTEIIKINYNKKNIVFSTGDIVSALIKKKYNKITNIKILKKIKVEVSFFGIILEKNCHSITIKNLTKNKDKIYFSLNSNIKYKFKNKIKINSIVKARPILSKNILKTSFLECELINIFGPLKNVNIFSQLAINELDIDHEFSNKDLDESRKLNSNTPNTLRQDLQNLPIITIDGDDAKDFDDAVYAEKLSNKNWKIIVSIADVSFFIKENSKLDKKAKKRGNSIYFPNMVIPMLPEIVSNDICSLKENKKRFCLSVEIIISNEGKKLSHKFFKSIIKSKKRFTYHEVQIHIDNNFHSKTKKQNQLISTLENLYNVFRILKINSKNRGALNLKSNEKKVLFDEKGDAMKLINLIPLESHKLIEEIMVLANVCAAEEIDKFKLNNVYRVHEKPSQEKINNFLKSIGKPHNKIFTNNPISTKSFNALIERTQNDENCYLINNLILRAQSQAKYTNIKNSHFGLGIKNYVHFTSPIRRYSDLLIHRILTQIIEKKDLKENLEKSELKNICDHISSTERKSLKAERITFDRLSAHIYSKNINKTYIGNVISIKKFGIFITFDNNLVEGLIPKKNLPRDSYIFNEQKETLRGKNNGLYFKLGLKLMVSVKEVDIFNGKLSLNFIKVI